MADMTYIKLFVDYLDAIEPLGDAERGRLFTSLLEYARTGEAPQLGGNERFLFPMMRAQIDRDNAAMTELSEARSKAGKIGAEAKQANAGFAKQNKQMPNLPSKSSYDKDKDKDKDKDYISPPSPPYRERLPRLTRLLNMPSCAEGLLTQNRSTSSTLSPGGGIPRASRSITGSRNSSYGKNASWRRKGAR